VLNNLFKYTELQTSFPINMVALVDGVPQTLSLKTILEQYIKHRVKMVKRRSEYELKEAKRRAHILEGYLIALDHIDEVIAIIKKSKDEPEAREKLMKKFGLSLVQTQAILEMQLRRLTGLERSKIEDRAGDAARNDRIPGIAPQGRIQDPQGHQDEVLYLKEKYGDERKTRVIKSKPGEITDEQLIENKEVIVVLTKKDTSNRFPARLSGFRTGEEKAYPVSKRRNRTTSTTYQPQ
jgi:DNA gyrase subunit A